jgi:hypothetical protein
MEKRMTVAAAAKELGMSAMALRFALRKGKFSQFGEAWKNEEKWTYYINPYQFYKYIGKDIDGTAKGKEID